MRSTTLIAIIALLVLYLNACQTPRQPRHDFVQVPMEAITAGLSDEQRRLVETKGIPDIVWQKPYDVFLWVYCKNGSMVDQYEFDARGMLMDFNTTGNNSLCKKQLQPK